VKTLEKTPFSKCKTAPAELPEQAASFDLPISLGMLAGSGQITLERFNQHAVVGELALDGTTRPTRGALSIAMAAAQQPGIKGFVVPAHSRTTKLRGTYDPSWMSVESGSSGASLQTLLTQWHRRRNEAAGGRSLSDGVVHCGLAQIAERVRYLVRLEIRGCKSA
jgi:Subunit ChlI of Mg-chelatase